MNTISKPDANPAIAAILTWFVFGSGHVLINGQTKKWIMTIVVQIIGTFLCCLPGVILGFMSIYDAYLTAGRLAAGEEIPEGEYSLPILYKVCSVIYKEATCSAAND